MHRTLCIPEIIYLIFTELRSCPHSTRSDSEVRQEENRDFAALARTCNAFHGPALNFLWREQDTLVNVLKCLPSHLWKEESVEISPTSTRRIFVIIGPIRLKDWDIPLAYAFRIRKLALSSSFQIHNDSAVVDVFKRIWASELPRDYMCPNLRTLVF
ncbi:hypothetical protein C8R45DRAFT_842196, partial [Mycena sanguinolenta]